MVPMPPSQAMIDDCQPLSCQAIAFIRLPGTVMTGSGSLRFGSSWTPRQYSRLPAATRALFTSAIDASVPSWVGAVHPGLGGVVTTGGGISLAGGCTVMVG